MRLGLHLPHLTYPGGPPTQAEDLSRIAALAEDTGFDRVSEILGARVIPAVSAL